MRHAIILAIFSCVVATSALGQSTISDDPLELSYKGGPMGFLLPGYEFGSDINGDPAFQDDLDNLGYKWELGAVRRFLGTRTSFEANVFLGWVEANASGTDQDMTLANPNGGGVTAFLGAPTNLESTLYHYGTNIALRDTWRTQFGGLSAGLAFSYMAFDQKFELERANASFINEQLNSDLLGGKVLFGWDGLFLDRRTTLDLAFGYFDLDVDYNYSAPTLAQSFASALADTTFTIELDFSTRFCLCGFDSGFHFGVMYISDLPQINHTNTAPNNATIDLDDGVLINAGLEFRL